MRVSRDGIGSLDAAVARPRGARLGGLRPIWERAQGCGGTNYSVPTYAQQQRCLSGGRPPAPGSTFAPLLAIMSSCLPLTSNYAYTLLIPQQRRSISRRTIAFGAAGFLAVSLLLTIVVWRRSIVEPEPWRPHLLPPLYSPYHEAELALPQHRWNRTAPGEHEKFFYVAGHLHGLWCLVLRSHRR